MAKLSAAKLAYVQKGCAAVFAPLRSTTALSTAILALSLNFAVPVLAKADGKRFQISITANSLAESLQDLHRRTGIMIVFSPEQVGELRTAGVKGLLTIEEALSKILEGTGLTAKTNGRGSYVIVEARDQSEQRTEAKPKNETPAPPGPPARQTVIVNLALEEILVTARRIEENIQRVPIAITAFSPDTLVQTDIKDLWTLTKQVGGLNICCAVGATALTFFRGIPNGAPTYFADVPSGATPYSNFFDIQSVQVLKGPQGTLFGQASNAGAFVYVPRKPSDVLGGYVTVVGGNYSRREIQAALDIPILEDRILFRLAAQSFYRDGYVTDVRQSRRYGDQNYYVVRPSLIVRFTDNLENYTLFQLTKFKGSGVPTGSVSDFNFSPTAQVPILGALAAVNGGTRAAFDALRTQVLATQLALGPYKIDGLSAGCATPLAPVYGPGLAGSGVITNLNYSRVSCLFGWNRDYFLANTTTWNITDNWTLKNILGLDRSKTFNQPTDSDGTPLLLFDGGHPKNNTPITGAPVWSDEIQLHGTLFDIVELTLGNFNTGRYTYPKVTYALQFGSMETAFINKQSSYTHAVYGQANVDLSEWLEGLTFTAGYRYTWDKIATQTWTLDPATLAVTKVTGGPASLAGRAHFSSGSHTLQLQYQMNPDTMFFLNNSKGYSTGGLQNIARFERFQPDSLNNLEVGVKSTFEFAGMKARVNASYYYGWYENVKALVSSLATNSTTGMQNLIVVTQNAASGRIQGLDADVTLLPTEYLEVGGFVAYARNTYIRWPSINPQTLQPTDLSDTPFIFIPKVKYGLRGSYQLPLDESLGGIAIGASYSHTGLMFTSSLPRNQMDPSNINTGLVCRIARTTANGYPAMLADGKMVTRECVDPHHNLDLNVQWRDVLGRQGLSATFTVTNVTKNLVNEGGCYCNAALGVVSAGFQVPRMFALRLQYAF